MNPETGTVVMHTNACKTKNVVVIQTDRVRKTFKNARKSAVRCRLEVEALRRLAGIDGIPILLEGPDHGPSILISRIPGATLAACPSPPDSCFTALREVIAEMLHRGVARHSLPPRDVIVRPDDRAGLVDFERITLRGRRFNPLWTVACMITRFHLCRLIGDHAPHLLTPRERRRLARQRWIRNGFRRFIEWRRRMRGMFQKRALGRPDLTRGGAATSPVRE